MNYCSLEDAFGITQGNGSNRNDNGIASAGKEARKEERKKAKRCKGPPLTFLDPQDPDRQHLIRPAPVPAMNRATGLPEHTPVDGAQGDMDVERELLNQNKFSYMTRTDDDPVGNKQRAAIPKASMIMSTDDIIPNLPEDLPLNSLPPPVAACGSNSFFGKDPDEGFANYVPDAQSYLMEPSFTTAFTKNLMGRAGSAALPTPSVRDIWKPITPAGANTAFFDALPKPGGTYQREKPHDEETLSKKIDGIMTRLNAIDRRASPEQTQTDILLFVSSGVFVLFMMDLLVRKGSSLRFLGGL